MKYFDGKDVCRYYLGWSGDISNMETTSRAAKDFRLVFDAGESW